MDQQFEQFVSTGLGKAKRLGVSAAEFYIVKSKSMSIEVKEGQIQDTKLAESQGIGVRIIKGQVLSHVHHQSPEQNR